MEMRILIGNIKDEPQWFVPHGIYPCIISSFWVQTVDWIYWLISNEWNTADGIYDVPLRLGYKKTVASILEESSLAFFQTAQPGKASCQVMSEP